MAHVAGIDSNTVADAASRPKHNDELEWAIDPKCCQDAMRSLNSAPDIDFVASRLKNYKITLTLKPLAVVHSQ